jgi:hypothetical protein
MLGKCLNPQKINGFHERVAKDLKFLFEKHVYIPKSVIWKSWESESNWIYTWVDNRKVSVPHFKNHPILVFSLERKNLQPFTLTKKKKTLIGNPLCGSRSKKLPFYEFLTTVIIGNILRVGFRLLPVGISNFAPGYNKGICNYDSWVNNSQCLF